MKYGKSGHACGPINLLAILSLVTLAGITIGIISYSCLRKDKSLTAYDDILNVALVPVDIELSNHIARLSNEFNQPHSLYYLKENEVDHTADSSLPHCTLMHFRVPKDREKKALYLERLRPLIGKTILIHVDGLESLEANAFVKDDLLAGISNQHKIAVKWLAVKKTSDLLALQEQIVENIADEEAYITGRRDTYRPHFTLWVQKKEKHKPIPTEITQTYSIAEHMKHSFLCRVVIGTTRKIGQIEKIVDTDVGDSGQRLLEF